MGVYDPVSYVLILELKMSDRLLSVYYVSDPELSSLDKTIPPRYL